MTRRRWSLTTRMAIRERYGCACHMCRQPLGERGFDLDHHIPLAIGGEDVEENLRPLCLPCHRLKTRSDVPMIAKGKRVHAKHVGARPPSRLPGGRHSDFRIKLDGTVVDRRTGEPIERRP